MIDIKNNIITNDQTLKTALQMLNGLGEDLTLLVTNNTQQLIGTLTDGDIRRGLLNGLLIDDLVTKFMNSDFCYVNQNNYKVIDVVKAKERAIQILPVLNDAKQIVHIINFTLHKSYLPVSAVIMAGGEGIRLRPLTDKLPKPLLKIGNKPIIEHGIDWLIRYGIVDYKIALNYLGEKITEHFGNGSAKNIEISYIREKSKLGTIGALGLVEDFKNEHILVLNSDLLTNIDLEEFFLQHESKNADLSVACIPFNVNIPYAIMETDHENVLKLREKPTITYQSNAGIYLIRKNIIKNIPPNQLLNATDLIEKLIVAGKKVVYYPILGYWLDIGKMDDYNKAQNDIKFIQW